MRGFETSTPLKNDHEDLGSRICKTLTDNAPDATKKVKQFQETHNRNLAVVTSLLLLLKKGRSERF